MKEVWDHKELQKNKMFAWSFSKWFTKLYHLKQLVKSKMCDLSGYPKHILATQSTACKRGSSKQGYANVITSKQNNIENFDTPHFCILACKLLLWMMKQSCC